MQNTLFVIFPNFSTNKIQSKRKNQKKLLLIFTLWYFIFNTIPHGYFKEEGDYEFDC